MPATCRTPVLAGGDAEAVAAGIDGPGLGPDGAADGAADGIVVVVVVAHVGAHFECHDVS